MPKFRIPVSFVFDGHFDVEARDEAAAVDMVNNGCGMTMRLGVHSNQPDDQVDWEFPPHPEKHIHRLSTPGSGGKVLMLTEDVLEADLSEFIASSDTDSLAELNGHVFGLDVAVEEGGICNVYRCVPIPGEYCDHRVDELKDVK